MDIVLFGIQGSGKGTLGKAVATKNGLEIFETGGELRKLSNQDSALAQKVKKIIEAGHLVPNDVVMEIVENFLKNLAPGKSVLFDGIPRKMEQAEYFDALIKKFDRKIMGIFIDVPKDVVMKRLAGRRICEKCKTVYPAAYTKNECEKCKGELVTRSDDNPESIKTRIEAYETETTPVIEHYKSQGKMLTMNGNLNIEDAEKEIFTLLAENLQA